MTNLLALGLTLVFSVILATVEGEEDKLSNIIENVSIFSALFVGLGLFEYWVISLSIFLLAFMIVRKYL